MSNVDPITSIDEYVSRSDWRVKANANQGFSLGGMILNIAGKLTANYWLDNIYSPEAGKAHREGDMHIHDLDMLSGYCAGWSLRQLLTEGFNGVPGKAEAAPPKHLSTALGQMVNFLGSLQNEWAGAQAFSSFDTYLAPFVKKDNMEYSQVKQLVQEFIFSMNAPSRWGCVPLSTEVLTAEGWKDLYSIKPTDTFYSINMQGELCMSKFKGIVYKKAPDKKIIKFKSDHCGYEQAVSKGHRVVHNRTWNSRLDDLTVSYSEDLLNSRVNLPVAFTTGSVTTSDLSADEIMLAAAIYCDGRLDYRGDNLHKVLYYKSEKRSDGTWFESLCDRLHLKYSVKLKKSGFATGEADVRQYTFFGESARYIEALVESKYRVADRFTQMDIVQSQLFIDTWMAHDGDTRQIMLQVDNLSIAKALQHILINAGQTSFILKQNKTTYVKIRQIEMVQPTEIIEEDFDDYVWCPSVTEGTVVFRDKNGNVVISGNSQTVFSNLTFDWTCPDDLKEQHPIIGGEEVEFTYGDCQKEMEMLNKAYIEVMTRGDDTGRIFTFPIPTYNITKDFPWDSENANLMFEMTAKYGLPYFQNFLNSELQPNMVRSMCCRLQLDLRELLKRGNGLFGSAEQTGSIGVVTINCARLGYLYQGQPIEHLYKKAYYLCNLAKDTLERKRVAVKQWMDEGLYPFSKRYLGHLRNHFSTIGVNGINEMIRNYTRDEHDITTPEGHQLAVDFLDHVRKWMVEFQEETGNLYNLEATPAEGCFTEDTKVFTINGSLSFKHLIGKKIPVLTRASDGKMQFKDAFNIHKTGRKQLVKITFDNGLEIKCTGNHPFALRHWDGRKGERLAWITAEELVPGDRIYSNYITEKDSGYMAINGGRQYLHKLVWEYFKGPIPEGYVVHHIDHDKKNNNYYNLMAMSPEEHKALHIKEAEGHMKTSFGKDNPFYGKTHTVAARKAIRANKSSLTDEQDKQVIELHNEGFSNAQIGRLLGVSRDVVRKCITFYERNSSIEIRDLEVERLPRFNKEAIDYFLLKGYDEYEISDILGGHNTPSAIKEYIKYVSVPNHTVEAIEYLDEYEDVYNMEVEDNHNYYVGTDELGFVLVHNCTYRFAREDQKRFDGIIQAGCKEAPYYTNSSQLPAGFTDDPFEALSMQDDLQRKYTGGTVLHLYMNERISSAETCKKIVKTALSKFRLPYITITPTFSICPKHGYLAGEHEYCPICDKELIARFLKSK